MTKSPEELLHQLGVREVPFGDVRKANGAAGQAAYASRFELLPFEAIQVSTARTYLIKGVVPRTGLTVIWGPPKCGKSFWAFDLMMHVALGWSYRNRRVQPGPVVYCALEGAEGFKARKEAWRTRNLPEWTRPVPFSLIAARLSLVAEHGDLIASIKAQTGETPPVAVVIDTLNRSLAGSESDDKDMGLYVQAADAIREAFACAVLIVHHCGVEGTRPRGHTSLTGAADAQLAVKRDSTGNIIVTVEWMKDGPEGSTFVSRLEPVDVGFDEDGDAITSCVIVEAEGQPVRLKAERKLTNRQRLGLDVLAQCILDSGKPLPESYGIPGNPRAAQADQWKAEVFRQGVLDGQAKNPRSDFKKLKESLQAKQLIGERDGLVWAVSL